MKNFSNHIENRTRDLSPCSAVPQPNAPPRFFYLRLFGDMFFVRTCLCSETFVHSAYVWWDLFVTKREQAPYLIQSKNCLLVVGVMLVPSDVFLFRFLVCAVVDQQVCYNTSELGPGMYFQTWKHWRTAISVPRCTVCCSVAAAGLGASACLAFSQSACIQDCPKE